MIYQAFETLEIRYKVPRINQRAFAKSDPFIKTPGGICTCGHPTHLHNQLGCMLIDSCGCLKVKTVLKVSDTRAFFQVTFGVFESHALARGMALAEQLSIEVISNMSCLNHCSNYSLLGACRHAKTGETIQVRRLEMERHEIYCDRCMEAKCM